MNIDEKAKELVDKFMNEMPSIPSYTSEYKAAKQCALICVDEILKVYEHVDENIIKRNELYRPLEEYDEWQKVKEAIKSLK